jgi:formate dehydrogenase subunit gamma
MVPTRKDFDRRHRHAPLLPGASNEQAKFDRFDYRQKFEYWGLILGAVVVIAHRLRPAVAGHWSPVSCRAR